MLLVAGVRCSFRGRGRREPPVVTTTGATEDPASGRAARPGGSAISRQTLLPLREVDDPREAPLHG